MELVTLFYLIDEFCKVFEPQWRRHLLATGQIQRCKSSSLTLSEVLTIIVWFHASDHKTFKGYYTQHISTQLAADFPKLVSYTRFLELMSSAAVPLLALLMSLQAEPTLANFIDSTKLAVCDNHRIRRHKVFRGLAARGKTSMGWFYGFKLHLIVNERGEIVSFLLTPGNCSDNHIPTVTTLANRLQAKLYGDRGYISRDLFLTLLAHDTTLITGIKKRMKNYLLPLWDKLMLRKRSIIETINDQLKNTMQVMHTRHRSHTNFLTNLLGGLIAYQLQPKKPSLHYAATEQRLLTEPLLLPA